MSRIFHMPPNMSTSRESAIHDLRASVANTIRMFDKLLLHLQQGTPIPTADFHAVKVDMGSLSSALNRLMGDRVDNEHAAKDNAMLQSEVDAELKDCLENLPDHITQYDASRIQRFLDGERSDAVKVDLEYEMSYRTQRSFKAQVLIPSEALDNEDVQTYLSDRLRDNSSSLAQEGKVFEDDEDETFDMSW